jgi:hypothetical protein
LSAPHGSASAPLPWLPEDLALPESDLERATRFTFAEAFRSDGPTSSPSISRTVRLPPSLLSILHLQGLPGGPGGAGHLWQAVQAGQACTRGRVVLGPSVRLSDAAHGDGARPGYRIGPVGRDTGRGRQQVERSGWRWLTGRRVAWLRRAAA